MRHATAINVISSPRTTIWSKWLARNGRESAELTQLRELSVEKHWELRREETFGVASAIYLRLPEDAELWLAKSQFTTIERERVARAFKAYS